MARFYQVQTIMEALYAMVMNFFEFYLTLHERGKVTLSTSNFCFLPLTIFSVDLLVNPVTLCI